MAKKKSTATITILPEGTALRFYLVCLTTSDSNVAESLGTIKYDSPTKSYYFSPMERHPLTVTMLRFIADNCERMTNDRKKGKQNGKVN